MCQKLHSFPLCCELTRQFRGILIWVLIFYLNTFLTNAFYTKQLQMLFIYQLARSKATCPFHVHSYRHWTPLIIVKDQYSHLVYPNMCIKQQTFENLGSIGHRSYKKIMKEKRGIDKSCMCR